MAIYQPESFYETTLTAAVTAAQATIPVTVLPNITSGYMVIEANTSNREIIKYTGYTGTAGGAGTLTGVVRGLASYGSDASAGTGKAHPAGTDISNKDVHYYYAQYYDFLMGTSATGANTMRIGDGNTISAGEWLNNTSGRFWFVNTSSISAYWGLSSNGQFVCSENGVDSYVVSAGGSGVTGGDGLAITAGVMDIDKLSTGGLQISATKLKVGYDGDCIKSTSAGELYFDKTVTMAWTGANTFAGTTNLSAVSAASCVFSTLPFCETATPTSGSHLTPKNYVDTQVATKSYFCSANYALTIVNGTSWKDVPVSAITGAVPAFAILSISCTSDSVAGAAVRPNGSTLDYPINHGGTNSVYSGGSNTYGILMTTTDANGVIEIRGHEASTKVSATLIGYIK